MAEIIKINERTWRIEEGFVRFFLLCGTEKAMLIDSGAGCPESRAIAESLTKLPIILVNTHGDGDHTSGNGAFESFYMHVADYENCGVAGRYPGSKLIELNDGNVFDLGERHVEAIGIPGHTYGSVALLDVEERTLYSGDSVQTGHIYMMGKHRQPAAFEDSLKKLEEVSARFDRIRPAHGEAEIEAGYVTKVREDWEKVLSGELEAAVEDLHGNAVKSYQGANCGFYCDMDA